MPTPGRRACCRASASKPSKRAPENSPGLLALGRVSQETQKPPEGRQRFIAGLCRPSRGSRGMSAGIVPRAFESLLNIGQVGFSLLDSFLDECRLGCRRPVLLQLLNQNRLSPLQEFGIPDSGFVGCGQLFGFILLTMDDLVSGQRTPYGKADRKEKRHRESRTNRGDEFLHGCSFAPLLCQCF